MNTLLGQALAALALCSTLMFDPDMQDRWACFPWEFFTKKTLRVIGSQGPDTKARKERQNARSHWDLVATYPSDPASGQLTFPLADSHNSIKATALSAASVMLLASGNRSNDFHGTENWPSIPPARAQGKRPDQHAWSLDLLKFIIKTAGKMVIEITTSRWTWGNTVWQRNKSAELASAHQDGHFHCQSK